LPRYCRVEKEERKKEKGEGKERKKEGEQVEIKKDSHI
jgi:hypothetical protein